MLEGLRKRAGGKFAIDRVTQKESNFMSEEELAMRHKEVIVAELKDRGVPKAFNSHVKRNNRLVKKALHARVKEDQRI